MRTAFVIAVAIGIPIVLIAGTLVGVRAYNQQKAERLALLAEQEHQQAHAQAIADETGGSTPGETLGLFAAAVRAGDAAAAASLCVPALRDRVAGTVADLAPAAREEVAGQLETAARSAVAPQGESFVTSDPVYVELVRYPSGAWKVASF